MMKNLILSLTIIGNFYCTATQTSNELKDDGIIINKIIDIVCEKEVRPKSVLISEQLLSNLDRYLTSDKNKKSSDSLSLLIEGKWNYLKQIKSDSYSKEWKQFSLPKAVNEKKTIGNKLKAEDLRFSTVQFSPEGTKAFVVYSRTINNISQGTVFFFFENKNGVWIHTAHYVPFFD
ncbi:hypothetical protein HDC90_001434 [Pedobacter sp. AK013]|uniref:hypothetical protein n=1 Tax=Pedobacter sp. AK013 TaxID=2723071 RepID=UPI0016074591|nr:hypothetical protein [Pedobacter sp. AK013]MBB6236819.1 hypothetical protein [Pedobacter sp. AK013]